MSGKTLREILGTWYNRTAPYNPYRMAFARKQSDITNEAFVSFTDPQLAVVMDLLSTFAGHFDEKKIKRAITVLNLRWNSYWAEHGQCINLDFKNICDIGRAIQLLKAFDNTNKSALYLCFKAIYDIIFDELIARRERMQSDIAVQYLQSNSPAAAVCRSSNILELLGVPVTHAESGPEEVDTGQRMMVMGFDSSMVPAFSPLRTRRGVSATTPTNTMSPKSIKLGPT